MERARQTAAVRSGIETDTGHGAVVPPLYLSTNYSFAGMRRPRDFDYSRSGNPTRSTLAAALAELDGGWTVGDGRPVGRPLVIDRIPR